jgi:hypothetical protein
MNKVVENWFYDNQHELGLENRVVVERIYCFDWDLFNNEHWDILDETYKGLPNWIGYEGCPYWFGFDEEIEPFLTASVEPPGLQVYGVLQVKDWKEWNAGFIEKVKNLPKRFIS